MAKEKASHFNTGVYHGAEQVKTKTPPKTKAEKLKKGSQMEGMISRKMADAIKEHHKHVKAHAKHMDGLMKKHEKHHKKHRSDGY